MAPPSPSRNITVQRVDRSLLSGEQDWPEAPQTNLSFRQIVEESTDRRADAARYELIARVDLQKAKDCFSKLCASKTLFVIPDTLYCDRTFARDVEEVYYLDAMDKFLQGAGAVDVRDLPILRRDLSHRAFSSFSRRPWYFTELPCPGLSQAWEVVRRIIQPSGLPVPAPFVVFYWHTELTETQDEDEAQWSDRMNLLKFCEEHEYLVLFLAVWWIEDVHGCRQYVVDKNTINYLHERCGAIPTIAGMAVQAILEYMRCAERRSAVHHNWMCFSDNSLEYSTFLWSVKKFGHFDYTRYAGLTYYCGMRNRKIHGQEQGRHDENCVLDGVLRGPDVTRIAGLLAIVTEEGWARHGPMRIGDLLQSLVHLYNRTVANGNRMLHEERVRQQSPSTSILYRTEQRLALPAATNHDYHGSEDRHYDARVRVNSHTYDHEQYSTHNGSTIRDPYAEHASIPRSSTATNPEVYARVQNRDTRVHRTVPLLDTDPPQASAAHKRSTPERIQNVTRYRSPLLSRNQVRYTTYTSTVHDAQPPSNQERTAAYQSQSIEARDVGENDVIPCVSGVPTLARTSTPSRPRNSGPLGPFQRNYSKLLNDNVPWGLGRKRGRDSEAVQSQGEKNTN